MTAPVLVVGGAGRTGGLVVRTLLDAGRAARVLTRDPARAARALSGASPVEVVGGDVLDGASLTGPLTGAGAAVVVLESADTDAARNGPTEVHRRGLERLLAAADRAGVPDDFHLVLVSQIYITRPEKFPQVRQVIAARRAGEEVLRAGGRRYSIVRPAWLTGAAAGRAAVRLEQGDTGDGQVARADVAAVCVQALEWRPAWNATFEVYGVPSRPAPWADVFAGLVPDPAPVAR